MKEITSGKIFTRIENNGCYYHIHEVYGTKREFAAIKFQEGRTRQVGLNGVHSADLIVILLDRMNNLQQGKFYHVAHEDISVLLNKVLTLLQSREEACDRDVLRIKLYGY